MLSSRSCSRLSWLAAPILLCLPFFQPAAAQVCAGDQDGNGVVAINELIAGVAAAIGSRPLAEARTFDDNGNGRIDINELILAVTNAILDCASLPRSDGTDAIVGSPRLVTNDAGGFSVLDIGGGAIPRPRGGAGLRRWRGALRGGAADCSAGPAECAGGGERRVESCTVADGISTLIESFTDCREAAGGATVVLNGRRERRVDNAGFCTSCTVGAVAETLQFTDFTLALDCEEDCPPGLQQGFVRAPALTVARSAEDDAGTAVSRLTGALTVENRATGEQFVQQLDDLRITTAASGSGIDMFFNGRVEDACLGALRLDTLANQPIAFDIGSKCARDGAFHVELGGAADPLAATLPAADERSTSGRAAFAQAAGGPVPADGFRETVFRAAGGEVYQVLQNAGGDSQFGGEDFRVTTLAGSAVGVARCDFQSNGSLPQIAAVAGIDLDAPTDVFRSGRIADATAPCFAPDANGGRGRVCVGPDCAPAPDCSCTDGADCATYSIGGATLAAGGEPGIPSGRTVGAGDLSASCASLVDGRSAYAFGAGEPTTEVEFCAAEPDDGLLLPKTASAFSGGADGSTLIVAYDAPFGARFLTGAAGFAIERVGGSADGCAPGETLMPSIVRGTTSLPPRVSFAGRRVELDFNADLRADLPADSCEDPALIRCVARPPATPTPNPGCVRGNLGNTAPVTRFGTTGPDSIGGASCGGGGTGAADFAFTFKPSAAGFYVIDTKVSQFDTVLSVRRGGCAGEELACNDDAVGLTSEIGVLMEQNETYIVVVDSFAPEGGDFTVNVAFAGASQPTPTVTPTPSRGRPDLRIVSLAAPSSANAGGQIDVSASVENIAFVLCDLGIPPRCSTMTGAAAGAFDLAFVFSADSTISGDDIPAGAGCSFSGLGLGQTASCQGRLTVPHPLSGSHFIGAIVDFSQTVAEASETNNIAGRPIEILGAGATATRTPTRPDATRTSTRTPTRPDATQTSTRTPTPSPTSPVPVCDDFNECTANDMCTENGCAGTLTIGGGCNDLNDCTINDLCVDDPQLPCRGDPAPSGTSCAAGCGECNAIAPGVVICEALPSATGEPCDSGIPCFPGRCQQNGPIGFCTPEAMQCPDTDGNACTDNCDPATGACRNDAPKCVPQCESCNPTTGECTPAGLGEACDDFAPCTATSRCTAVDVGGTTRGFCLADSADAERLFTIAVGTFGAAGGSCGDCAAGESGCRACLDDDDCSGDQCSDNVGRTGFFTSVLANSNAATSITGELTLVLGSSSDDDGRRLLRLADDAALSIELVDGTCLCLQLLAATSIGQLDCNGGAPYDTQVTQALGSDTPSTVQHGLGEIAGPGDANLDLLAYLDKTEVTCEQAACATREYSGLPIPLVFTTTVSTGVKGPLRNANRGEPFDCNAFATPGSGGALVTGLPLLLDPVGDTANTLRLSE